MEERIFQLCTNGDVETLLHILSEDETVLDQKTTATSNTVLHLAALHGHANLVAETIRLRPDLVTIQNARLETSLHKACRNGHIDVVELLLDADPSAAFKLDSFDEEPLAVACSRGHLEIVELLVEKLPSLLTANEHAANVSFHVSMARGHMGIVLSLLKLRPDFLWKADGKGCRPIHLAATTGDVTATLELLKLDDHLSYIKEWQGMTPLHLAVSEGHMEVVREYITRDPKLCLERDRKGLTPLHTAVMKGLVQLIQEILACCPESGRTMTKKKESVLHLGIKSGSLEAVQFLVGRHETGDLVNLQDNDGNTILHLSCYMNLPEIAGFLVERSNTAINILNNKRLTALDLIEKHPDTSTTNRLRLQIRTFGGQKGVELLSKGVITAQISPRTSSDRRSVALEEFGSPAVNRILFSPVPKETVIPYPQDQMLMENSQHTVVIVATLIAFSGFLGGLNPPGGVYGDGKAIVGNSIAFKVFIVTNGVALFLSLCLVVVLVGFVPFKRKQQPAVELMMLVKLVMWVAVSAMASAYLAAMWIVIPRNHETKWIAVGLLSALCVLLGVTLIFVGCLWIDSLLKRSGRR